jgi:tetratricopeptide (TPR) repeat protein
MRAALFSLLFFSVLSCVPAPREETLIRYAKARSLYDEGRVGEAAALLAGEGRFVPALVLRGKAEYFSGNHAEAEKTFRRALKIRPSAAEAALYLARTLQEERAAEALALVESLASDNPLDTRVLRLAAGLENDRGPEGRAAALAYLDRAAEAASEYALVFIDRARFRWTAGKAGETLEDLARARALLPRDSSMLRAVDRLESAVRTAGYGEKR